MAGRIHDVELVKQSILGQHLALPLKELHREAHTGARTDDVILTADALMDRAISERINPGFNDERRRLRPGTS